jgi:hypothetical protein
MQDIYQCTRCGTGWLAKRVEPRGLGRPGLRLQPLPVRLAAATPTLGRRFLGGGEP